MCVYVRVVLLGVVDARCARRCDAVMPSCRHGPTRQPSILPIEFEFKAQTPRHHPHPHHPQVVLAFARRLRALVGDVEDSSVWHDVLHSCLAYGTRVALDRRPCGWLHARRRARTHTHTRQPRPGLVWNQTLVALCMMKQTQRIDRSGFSSLVYVGTPETPPTH